MKVTQTFFSRPRETNLICTHPHAHTHSYSDQTGPLALTALPPWYFCTVWQQTYHVSHANALAAAIRAKGGTRSAAPGTRNTEQTDPADAAWVRPFHHTRRKTGFYNDSEVAETGVNL